MLLPREPVSEREREREVGREKKKDKTKRSIIFRILFEEDIVYCLRFDLLFHFAKSDYLLYFFINIIIDFN